MTVLNRHQRDVIRVDTGIDPILIDRVVDAYDALLERDDVEGYKTYMTTAVTQLGYENIVPPEKDRPTPVDIIKSFCIKAVADKRGWSFKRTAHYLEEYLKR